MKNPKNSINRQIQLIDINLQRLGVIIAPIIPDYNFSNDKSNDPHRHDYYGIFYVSRGQMAINLDNSVMDFNDNGLAVIYPHQVHEIIRSDIKSGWILFFDRNIIENILFSQDQQNLLENVLFELTVDQALFFDNLFAIIRKEIDNNKSTSNLLYLVHSLIQACLLKLCCMRNEKLNHLKNDTSKSSKNLTRLFLRAVKRDFNKFKQASAYADMLNVTTSHLNDTLQRTLGKTTTSLIQDEIIREAQRQLIYSTKNIGELSFYLGYDDPKYFIRLFSKNTGISPARYRKLHVNDSVIIK